MIQVYILRLSDNTHYTGITNNITRRLLEHNKGRSISTRYKRPITLIYLQQASDRKAARRIETRIKGIGAKRYLRMKSTLHHLNQDNFPPRNAHQGQDEFH